MMNGISEKTRVLIVSHGHPSHIAGGGEIAAYNLHQQINKTADFQSMFFARHDKAELLHGGTPFSGTGKPNEILFYSQMPDWFRFSQPDKAKVWRDFRQMLESCKPDIVHFHHYVHLGLEMIREVRRYSQTVKIVLTLHEYFGICHNHGQMVKTDGGGLCQESSPSACTRCFPEYSPQDFFLRNSFIKSHFSLVDQFVSPSQFLAKRYIAWGLPDEKIAVVENLLDDNPALGNRAGSPDFDDGKIRIGYFGQINWYKGLDVLLESLKLLPESVKSSISLEINGSGLEKLDSKLQQQLLDDMTFLDSAVSLNGPYVREDLDYLMSGMDWLVVPSKWWENSPMVILEAKKNGLPVICSDLGGMAEKVIDGVTGLHFRAGSASSLSRQIQRVALDDSLREEYSANIKQSYSPDEDFDGHLALYRKLVAKSEKQTVASFDRVA